MNTRVLQIIVALLVGFISPYAWSLDIKVLTIEGVIGPGDAGQYPADAAFSWIDHRYPGSTVSHIWQLAPGTDGGLLIGQAQPLKGALTEARPMYNIQSWLYSIGDGITFKPDNSLDFSNLRMDWGDTILDLGNTPGFDSLVPFVSDISQLSGTENGYVIYADNSYDLIYHSAGLCDGCILTVHFHGNALAVPEPRVVLLWLFGLALLYVRLRRPNRGQHAMTLP